MLHKEKVEKMQEKNGFCKPIFLCTKCCIGNNYYLNSLGSASILISLIVKPVEDLQILKI